MPMDESKEDVKVVADPTKSRIQFLGREWNAGYLSLLILVIQNATLVLMTRWSRAQHEGPMYKASTIVIMAEILKFVISTILMYKEHSESGSGQVAFRDKFYHVIFCLETVKLCIPAALFTFQNYLIFVSLSNLDAMTFQILSQIKLLLAAVFSVWLLERYLTCVQWSSVLLLTLGIVLSTQGKVSSERVSSGTKQNNALGVISCVASGVSSAFASVYFEKILKGSAPSIAVRNIQLGIFSLVFAAVSILVIDGVPGQTFSFFAGYSASTWVLVTVHAGGGILVAVVVKYADNILKGFATGVAIIVSGLYASLAWGFAPTPHFIAGSVVVTLGTCVYNVPDPDHPLIKKLARSMPGGSRIPLDTGNDQPV
eukprot:TRINITY_DN919_c6_g1_i2.p1 TRINITY_DN919_c6_g1~~TRINITY_DN919_c6_g1_i2.p1  ORF type:complete len:370 (+),score=49.42 TRINITY_DN919_c6_g1_i2:94-1203(+)